MIYFFDTTMNFTANIASGDARGGARGCARGGDHGDARGSARGSSGVSAFGVACGSSPTNFQRFNTKSIHRHRSVGPVPTVPCAPFQQHILKLLGAADGACSGGAHGLRLRPVPMDGARRVVRC